jgi:beta-lactamase superfamily II metal-dependent hydrolase
MVFMIHWQSWKLLWLSDAGRLSEQALLESGMDIRADVIVAGMHKTDFSLTSPFLAAVSPKTIIIPRLSGSAMDETRIAQLKNWQDAPFQIINRQKTGGLTLTISEKGELMIHGFLDGSSVALNRLAISPVTDNP